MRLVGSKGIMLQESLCINCFCFTKELQPRRIYRISGTEDLIGNGNWNLYVEFDFGPVFGIVRDEIRNSLSSTKRSPRCSGSRTFDGLSFGVTV
ncbi:hypothetical protein LXL04_019645 [Taraxacum kok-saghyz]